MPANDSNSGLQQRIGAGAPQPTTRDHDVIVVGSGMSGLCSAIILAKEGNRVLVLEQHYRPGGFLHRFFRKGGIEFDVGFHYLGGVERDQVLGVYFRYLGIFDSIELIPLDPNGYDELVFPDFRFVIPAGEDRFKGRLIDRFPGERAAIDKYFADIQMICDGFAFYRMRAEQDLKHADHWLRHPMGNYLDRLTTNPQLKSILLGQSPLYGVEPSRTPAALHALVTDSFMQNPYSIKGGGDALAAALVEQVEALGGSVKTRRRVTEITVGDNRQVTGVITDRGEVFRAPIVISCAHPKVTVRLLPDGVFRPGYRRRILGMEDGISTLSVFATTDVDLSDYGGRNYYSYKMRDLDELYSRTHQEHEFVFVTVPTAREGPTKSGLHQIIALGLMPWQHVQRWENSATGERGVAYEAFKQQQTESLMELVYELLPQLRDRINSVEAATPLTNRDYAASERGAAYGIHHTVDQSGRYGIRPRTRVSGLYLTGQSVLMPGVCGVTISAFHTCSHILGTEHLMGRVHAET